VDFTGEKKAVTSLFILRSGLFRWGYSSLQREKPEKRRAKKKHEKGSMGGASKKKKRMIREPTSRGKRVSLSEREGRGMQKETSPAQGKGKERKLKKGGTGRVTQNQPDQDRNGTVLRIVLGESAGRTSWGLMAGAPRIGKAASSGVEKF